MEDSKIILSIIVPIYNVAQYLHKCVDSLLNQDISNYEIILVDDGSPDACPQICDEYAATHDNIRVIHQKNGGLSAARNAGLRAAKGEYVCFVDSDDYWEPNVLGGLMAQIERDQLDVLRFDYQNVRLVESRETRVESKYEVFEPYKRSHRLDNDYSAEPIDGVSFLNTRMSTACYAWTLIIKRSLLMKGLGDERMSGLEDDCLFTEGIYFEDTDWTPRMLVRAKRVASTKTVVYNYLVRQGSITNAVNRSKQKKVLEDKMRLIGEMKRQAEYLQQEGKDASWFDRMISDTVISVINILSTTFYPECKQYLERLRELRVFPISSRELKARLINFSPRLAVELLHVKHQK